MAITVLDIEQVRRMTDTVTASGIYTDAVISGYLTDNDEDKNATAAQIWSEKVASMLATTYDISADDASYKYSQRIDNAKELARYYASKRNPKTSLWIKNPEETDEDTGTI